MSLRDLHNQTLLEHEETSRTRQRQMIARRYADRVGVAVLAAGLVVTFDALKPEALDAIASVGVDLPAWNGLLLVLAALAVSWLGHWTAGSTFGPTRWISHPGWIPPTALGFFIACPSVLFQRWAWLPPWILWWAALGLSSAAVLLLISLDRKRPPPIRPKHAELPAPLDRDEADQPLPAVTVEALIANRDQLPAWLHEERPLADGEEDLVGVRPQVHAVREALLRGHTVGLIGGFGSGKSSILRLAHRPLWERGHRLVEVPGWSLDGKTAASAVLAAGLSAIRNDIALLDLRGLPARYEAAARGVTPRGLHFLFDQPATNPLHTLQKLDDALGAAGLVLNFDVQDLDRRTEHAGEAVAAVQSLLDRLKADGCEHLNFVLSVGGGGGRLAVERLCERVVHVPGLRLDAVTGICHAVLNLWLEQAAEANPQILLPGGETTNDPGLDTDAAFPRFTFRRVDQHDQHPFSGLLNDLHRDALHTLLASPRRLKAALRAATVAWGRLMGEVHREVLLVMEAVRAVAPEAMPVIERHFGGFPPGLTDPNKALDQLVALGRDPADERKEALQAAVEHLPAAEAAAVIHLSEILAGSPRIKPVGRAPLQAPQTDISYWQRMYRIDPRPDRGPRDQVTLLALQEARWSDFRRLIDLLSNPGPEGFSAVRRFHQADAERLVERFRPSASSLLQAASQSHHEMLSPGKPELLASGRVLAAERLLVLANTHELPRELLHAHTEAVLAADVQVSLQMAVRDLAFWGHGHRPDHAPAAGGAAGLEVEAQEALYAHLNLKLEAVVRGDPVRLCGILDPRSIDYWHLLPMLIRRSEIPGASTEDQAKGWAWLRPVVLAGLDAELPQIAHLVTGLVTTPGEPPAGETNRGERGFPRYLVPRLDWLDGWVPDPAEREAMLAGTLRLLASEPQGIVPESWRSEARDVIQKAIR